MEYGNNPYGGSGGYGGRNPYQDSNPYGGGNRYGGGGGYGQQSGGYGQQGGYGASEPDVEMNQYGRPPPSQQPSYGLPSGPGARRPGGGPPPGPRGGARPPPQGGYPPESSSRPGPGFGAPGTGFDGRNNAPQPSGYDSGPRNEGGYGMASPPPQMTSYNAPSMNGGTNGSSGRSILEDCRDIDRAIDELEARLSSLQSLQRRVLNDQASAASVDAENADIMTEYRSLGQRLKKVKSSPAAGQPSNAPQVGRVDRRLKKAINDYQRLESDFRRQMQDQQARQYRIVRPDASEEEVQAAVEDGGGQIFQQALLNSDRTGQARSALGAVRARHEEIRRIEETMIELAQLFQDLDQLVVEQEPLVQTIEQKGEEVKEDIVQANTELDKGIVSARAARKKKWICLLILILIIVIVGVVAGIYLGVIKPQQSK